MVSMARLDWLTSRVEMGDSLELHCSSNINTMTLKFTFTLRSTVAALGDTGVFSRKLIEMVKSYNRSHIITDRGHRHSEGHSVAIFYAKPRLAGTTNAVGSQGARRAQGRPGPEGAPPAQVAHSGEERDEGRGHSRQQDVRDTAAERHDEADEEGHSSRDHAREEPLCRERARALEEASLPQAEAASLIDPFITQMVQEISKRRQNNNATDADFLKGRLQRLRVIRSSIPVGGATKTELLRAVLEVMQDLV
eukprot:TRINITY_DN28844_c0_g1_i1.p1 TRINITY_DN28844_c0_g1~~TRINITY_DN28844_c0_g1_i1.p1  ORF type:complete len:251 (+),score=29.52 TRINITY_DN28844_c0_g1_i1:136-888(+)